jgi:hypothetical protein
LYETRTGCGNPSDENAKPERSLSKKSGGIKVRAIQANEMCSTQKDQINTELLAIFKGKATGASA